MPPSAGAAPPSLSFSSSRMRWASFLPTPGAAVRAFSSCEKMASAKRSGRQNGQRGLRADAGHAEQQLKIPQLLARAEAVDIERILADAAVGIEPRALAHMQARERIGRRPAGVADTAAVDDGQIALEKRDLAVEIIKHYGFPPMSRASCDVDERAWHSAMAMASAASSGRGMRSSRSRRRVISMT